MYNKLNKSSLLLVELLRQAYGLLNYKFPFVNYEVSSMCYPFIMNGVVSPKSINLSTCDWSLENKQILSGFRSLWTYPKECNFSIRSMSCIPI